jgi:hypothetical protein
MSGKKEIFSRLSLLIIRGKKRTEFFERDIFPSKTSVYEMYGDNGGRNISRTLHLGIESNNTEVKHCYQHQGSNMWLVPSVNNRQLAFARQTKALRCLLQVSSKLKLTRRGEGVILRKLSLERVFNIHATVFPSHYHIVFLQQVPLQI